MAAGTGPPCKKRCHESPSPPTGLRPMRGPKATPSALCPGELLRSPNNMLNIGLFAESCQSPSNGEAAQRTPAFINESQHTVRESCCRTALVRKRAMLASAHPELLGLLDQCLLALRFTAQLSKTEDDSRSLRSSCQSAHEAQSGPATLPHRPRRVWYGQCRKARRAAAP